MTDEAVEFLMNNMDDLEPCGFFKNWGDIPCTKPPSGGEGMYSHYCEEHSSRAFKSFLQSIDDYKD